ncbi:MAG: alpha/beta hydrolase [Candidatus Paceibacterota bacterium]
MEKLELKNRKNQKIVGVLEIPEDNIVGTCIVQHGWGGHKNKATVQTIKNSFLESGFQTFNFDTTNSFGESDGDFEKSTLGLFYEDLEDVVKWIQNQKWFVGPVALTGHSKGGYSVIKYAETYPEEISYLVPIAPVVSGKLSFEKYEKNKPEEFKKWKETGIRIRIGKEGNTRKEHFFQFEERLNHDLIPKASNISMPVLIVVGSEDESCPLEHQEILFNAILGTNKTLKIIKGAPHSFNETYEQEECKSIIKEWLLKNIK